MIKVVAISMNQTINLTNHKMTTIMNKIMMMISKVTHMIMETMNEHNNNRMSNQRK